MSKSKSWLVEYMKLALSVGMVFSNSKPPMRWMHSSESPKFSHAVVILQKWKVYPKANWIWSGRPCIYQPENDLQTVAFPSSFGLVWAPKVLLKIHCEIFVIFMCIYRSEMATDWGSHRIFRHKFMIHSVKDPQIPVFDRKIMWNPAALRVNIPIFRPTFDGLPRPTECQAAYADVPVTYLQQQTPVFHCTEMFRVVWIAGCFWSHGESCQIMPNIDI